MSSKSAKKAKQVRDAKQSNTGTVGGTTTDCPLNQHFFKLTVVDDRGKSVNDVQPSVELNDGTVVSAALNSLGAYDTGKILAAASPCRVAFPTLYDAEWWPDGEGAGTPSEEQQIAIADGDCAVKAALDKGFRDYTSIWSCAKNGALKGEHPNPNALLIGDALWAPDTKTKSISKAVDQEWRFVIKSLRPPKLSVILVEKDEKPLNEWNWESTAPAVKSGKTGASALIEIADLDASAVAAKLTVLPSKLPPLPPLPPLPGPLPDPPPYPAAINPAEFKDKEWVKPADSGKMEFNVKVGSLPTHKDKTGVLARLCNLGYNCDVASDDAVVTKVVKSYQQVVLKQDNPSGNQADLQQPLEDRHSNP